MRVRIPRFTAVDLDIEGAPAGLGPIQCYVQFKLEPPHSCFSDATKLGVNGGWEPPTIYHYFNVVLDAQNRFSASETLPPKDAFGLDGKPVQRRRGSVSCTGRVDLETWTFHLEGT